MRKFFSEYPIFATFTTSCLIVVGLFLTFSTLIIFLISKAVTGIAKTANATKTEDKMGYTYVEGTKTSTNKFLKISVEGVILAARETTDPLNFFLSSYTYGYEIKNTITEAAKDTNIKGIVLEINSPGGTIAGANAISDAVIEYKKQTNKPVIAHISGLGASGAYWAAVPADKILADAGSLTGSIGVIIGPFKEYSDVVAESNFSGSVTTSGGITSTNITAGFDKDMGDPFQPLSERAKKSLQSAVNNQYEEFVQHVADFRKIEESTIKETIGALVYDNVQARELKLIDSEANRQEAYAQLADLAGVPGSDYQVVQPKFGSFWANLFESAVTKIPTQNVSQESTCILCNQMLYLYGNYSL